MTGTFGMFVKFPERGRVKTRLAAEVGDAFACELYSAFLLDLVPRFENIAVRRVLAYAPDDEQARDYFQKLGGGRFELWPQPEGSLGDRMSAFFEAFGPEPAVLIGSDSPTLDRCVVEQALQRLAEVDCVLGPAADGGVYLIGLRGESSSRLLRPIEWSTSRVLEQILAEVCRRQLTWEALPLGYDVDTRNDVDFLRGHLALLHQAQPDLWRELEHTRRMLTAR